MIKQTNYMRLNILFVNSIGKNKWGGGEKWMIQTAKGLLDIGHQVKIAVRKNSVLQQKAEELGLETMPISYNTDFDIKAISTLRSYFRHNKTDIAICSLNRDIRIVGIANKLLFNRPMVVGRQGVQLIKNKWKYKVTFSHLADGILTNSKSLKTIYDSYGWWDKDYVRVIYNGIKINEDTSVFDYNKITPISENTKIILSAGRLDDQKGFPYFILAAQFAKINNKDWKFFIAGSGKDQHKLERIIRSNGLENHVFLLGFQKNIYPLFKQADVFVLASLYEGMPNVLLEAMLDGVPVITTPVNGAAELVANNKTGLYIETKNPKSIYEQLNQLFENPEAAKQMTSAAKEFVNNNFTLSQSVDSVNSYFQELVLQEKSYAPYTIVDTIKKKYSAIKNVRHKNIKAWYYFKNFIRIKISKSYAPHELERTLNALNRFDEEYINNRVNYYNKVNTITKLPNSSQSVKEFIHDHNMETYYLDMWKYVHYFDPSYRLKYEFGDITEIPQLPSIVKSRPISDNNANSVLLNLNKVRHFIYVKDNKKFFDKINKIIWRGNIWSHQPQRVEVLKKHFNNPFCNIGHTNDADIDTEWKVEKLTIEEQLAYKFILSIEGNDVATNLKWIMSSKSIAVMPKPKFETWFMEGQLIPDYHYILIKDDYSDLTEKLLYYIENPEKGEEIRINANNYINQFRDKKREDLISTLVLKKYFKNTNIK